MIKTEIYEILASDPSYTMSYTQQTEAGIDAVLEYMRSLNSSIQWNYEWSAHPDECGAEVFICWIEEGELHTTVLSYRTKESVYHYE